MKRALVSLILLGLCGLMASPEADVAKALEGPLKGYVYNKRLATPGLEDHLLVFTERDGPNVRLVAWTEATGGEERFAAASVSPMAFTVYDPEGNIIEQFDQKTFSLIMKLTTGPRIYAPTGPNDYLRVTAAVETLESPITVLGPQTVEITCTFANPLQEDLFFTSEFPAKKAVIKPGGRYTLKKYVEVGRPAKPIVVPVDGLGIVQNVIIRAENPLALEVWPRMDKSITLELSNPTGNPFRGEGAIHLVTGDGQEPQPFRFPLIMSPKERTKSLQVPLNYDGMLPFPIQVKATQRLSSEMGKEFVLVETPPLQFLQLGSFVASDAQGMPEAYEGRTQGNVYWSMSVEQPPEGAPVPGRGILVLDYLFKPGGLGVKVRPEDADNLILPSAPQGYGLWVFGDNSGNYITCGMRDDEGRLFQPNPVKLDWRGWRYLTFRWPEGMTEPVRWDSIFTIVKGDGEDKGAIYLNNPTLLFELPELVEEIEVPEESEKEPEIIDRRNEVPSAIPIYNMPSAQ